MKIEKIKNKLFEKINLSQEEAEYLFERILIGEIDEFDLCSILLALKLKGETSDEIAGAIRVLDKFKIKFKKELTPVVGISKIGNDIKISELTSFILNSCNTPVIKFEDYAQNINIFFAQKYFKENKFVSLNPKQYHPSIKKLLKAEKKLGIKTIFNNVPLLIHPANPELHIIAISDNAKIKVLAEAIRKAEIENVIIFDGFKGYEINGKIKEFKISVNELENYIFKKIFSRSSSNLNGFCKNDDFSLIGSGMLSSDV